MPALIRVSPTAGRSTVVFAPISTSSSITTGACCGIFSWLPSARVANPYPSLPITAPFCTMTRGADRAAFADGDVRVQHAVGADRRPGTDDGVRVQDGAIADPRAGADHGEGAHLTLGADHRIGGDNRVRVHAGGRPQVRRQRLRGAGERHDRVAGCGSPRTARRPGPGRR